MPLDPRVICSTITLRHIALAEALREIRGLGFSGIDLGALPGVCDHVPYQLTGQAVAEVAEVVVTSGLAVRSVNADVGDLNEPLEEKGRDARTAHIDRLLDLCAAIGSTALVLPNGRQAHTPIASLDTDFDLVAQQLTSISELAAPRGIELWVEAPHWFRLAFDLERSRELVSRLPEAIGIVCDVSHITAGGSTPRQFLDAFGPRTRHVHIRDAEPNYIHHSVGRGQVDFPDLINALQEMRYDGAISLELETRDVEDVNRPAEALRAGNYLSDLLDASTLTNLGAQQ